MFFLISDGGGKQCKHLAKSLLSSVGKATTINGTKGVQLRQVAFAAFSLSACQNRSVTNAVS